MYKFINFSSKKYSAILKNVGNHKSINQYSKKFSTSSDKHNEIHSTEILQDNMRLHYLRKDFTLDFPFVWLRDNCQCDKCFHPVSQSRMIDCKTFNVDEEPQTISLEENKTKIVINWKDKHVSAFNLEWLEERSFQEENRDIFLSEMYKPKKIAWGQNDFKDILNKFDFMDVLTNDKFLKDWLEALSIYGVTLVENAPASDDSCRKLANRVEFIKKTHYGEEFTVKNKPGTTNVAYLSSYLQLHTDLPYYEYKPGVNLLHCLEQSLGKGGKNMLSDGLYAANYLKAHNIECYKILSQTSVDWNDIGQENNNKFHSMHRGPVICENSDGEVIRIDFSVPQRSSHFNVPVEKVKPWYKALKTFVDLVHEQSAYFKLSPGQLLCFDNRRLLHGRSEYHDTENNTRHIIGVYLDWDFIYSRLRVLSEK